MTQHSSSHTLDLIPQPNHIELTDDHIMLSPQGHIYTDQRMYTLLSDDAIDAVGARILTETMTQQLLDTLELFVHAHWSTASADERNTLPVAPSEESPDELPEAQWQLQQHRVSICTTISLSVNATVPSQGYTLTIHETGEIVISASSPSGWRNGIQTLRQIIMTQYSELPVLYIEDSPALLTRGLTYDVSRGRVPTRAALEDLIDTLCLYKYNHFELYIEHTFAFPQTREAWDGKDPLNAEDIRALDEYCFARGIELVPALASFGHMYDILRTHAWRELSEHPQQADRPFSFIERMIHHTLNPTHPDALGFICSLIDEYASLFRSHHFNIGGDETFDLGTGASAHRASEVGVPRLYAEHISALCAHMKTRGLSPIVYADIPLKHPELLSLLPKEVTLANWDYRVCPSEENVSTVHKSGYSQLVCPGAHTWNRMLPALCNAWDNISSLCSYGRKYQAHGMLMTDWGDYGHINDPLFSLPSFAYAAEHSWHAHPDDKDTLDHAISVLTYGDRTGCFVSELSSTQSLQSFSWADAVQYLEIADSNGIVNPDVAWVLGYDETVSSISDAHRLFFKERLDSISAYKLNNDLLRMKIADLHSSSTVPDTISRTAILMLRGQILLNTLGATLAYREHILNAPTSAPPCDNLELAQELSTWFAEYSTRWHATSRHSQIEDIHHIFSTYATLLTEGHTNS